VITTGCGSAAFNYDPSLDACGTITCPEVRLPLNTRAVTATSRTALTCPPAAASVQRCNTQQFDILAYATNLVTEPLSDSGDGSFVVHHTMFGNWHPRLNDHIVTNTGRLSAA
jgi:hypothetical protein